MRISPWWMVAILAWAPAGACAGATPDLLEIYRQAVAGDPAWASAQNANLAAQEKGVQGRALILPVVTASASTSHSQTDVEYNGRSSVFSSGKQEFDSYGYSVSIAQPLYRRQNSIQYEQSRVQVSQADEQLNDARQNLMLRVAQAYFDVLLAQDDIQLVSAQKAAIARQMEQAQANFDVGTATITDVHEAQARLDLVLAQEIAATNALEARRHAIQSFTGQLPVRLAPLAGDLNPALPEPNSMEKWVEIAEGRNLTLKVQQHALALAEKEVERTRAGHLPTLDLVGSYSDTHSNGGVSGWGSDLKNTTIGLQFEVPLYSGGATSSVAREAEINRRKAQHDVETAQRAAALQTRQAYLAVTSAAARVKAFEQALISSQSQLDSTSLGYEVGVRTSVDVLNAQQQRYTAQRDLLEARYVWLVSVLKLKAVSGVLDEAALAEVNTRLRGS